MLFVNHMPVYGTSHGITMQRINVPEGYLPILTLEFIPREGAGQFSALFVIIARP